MSTEALNWIVDSGDWCRTWVQQAGNPRNAAYIKVPETWELPLAPDVMQARESCIQRAVQSRTLARPLPQA